MNSVSPLVAWLLVVLCFAIAGVFAWQQLRTLGRLRRETDLPVADRTYFRRQAVRRLVGCGLLIAIGGLIGGSYISGQEEWVDRLGQVAPAEEPAAADPDLQQKKRLYIWYWIAVLVLLLALVIVAAIDFFAIRSYGARHFRRLYADRKAMLEKELAELRKARGYRNGEM